MREQLEKALLSKGSAKKVVFLTGAGISKESGIPTFRGDDGVWEKTPLEYVTYQFFSENYRKFWAWRYSREAVFEGAVPNEAHQAISSLAANFDVKVVTQNIDHLHHLSGLDDDQVIEVHGRRGTRRCEECGALSNTPEIGEIFGDTLTEEQFELLTCPECEWLYTRPHVLLFDEYYNERWYRAITADEWIREADVLITVGTAGVVPFPLRAQGLGSSLKIDINPDLGPVGQNALLWGGLHISKPATEGVAEVVSIVRSILT